MAIFQRWTEVRRTYTPPDSKMESINGFGINDVERILYGYTTIEYVTSRGKPKFVTLNGDQRIRDEGN